MSNREVASAPVISYPATASSAGSVTGRSGWPLAPRDAIAPGRSIVRRLAGGGAHEVFLVETAGSHGRAVAKLPRPHLASDPHSLLRLRGEGRALTRLAHGTLPQHLDTVLTGPYPHLLMEHIPGPTLRDAIKARGPLSWPIVASVGSVLAGALDHLASADWVHLDVKPSNIVLNRRPYLIDFELARSVPDAARISRPSGTWAYMAPEQRAAGLSGPATLGPPADVFSLAASLHEALAGPLTCPAVARRSSLRGPLGPLLADALEPMPHNRPTARELAVALGCWADRPDGQLRLAARECAPGP